MNNTITEMKTTLEGINRRVLLSIAEYPFF